MAYAPLHLLCLLVFVLPISIIAQGNNRIEVGSSLTAKENEKPWLSPSGHFAFGFHQVQDTDQFLLSIWFDKIPETIVWYGNEGHTVPRGAKVALTADRGLVLSDSQGKELWNSTGSNRSEVSHGFMNDTGNFEIVGLDSSTLWDSFSNPTDTLLPTQTMEINGELYSRLRETNFTGGRFQLRLLGNGNLVLNNREILTNFAYDPPYYISNTYDSLNTSNSGYRLIFNETGHIYILRGNGGTFDLTVGIGLPVSEYYHRATLNVDGVFVQYQHPKVFTGRPNWTVVWQVPDNICVAIFENIGSGACGYNSVCRLDDNERPVCECPQGYSLLDPDDKYGSCKPNFPQNCDDKGSSSAEDLYDIVELNDTNWPTSDYERLYPISELDCSKSCLDDCFCAVAIYGGAGCWKKKLPLSNGKKDPTGKAFLKVKKRDLSGVHPQSGQDYPIQHEKKDQDTLIVVGSVLLGSSAFFNLMFVGAACLGFFCIYHKKTVKLQSINSIVETNLRYFTYKELLEVTNGFKEELGRGAFGIVYKGVIRMSSTTVVAVKKLDRVVQDGDKEFKTEVNVIAQTHHKNLVRLLGFCEDGEHRLLVYEYMSNGTLASFVFGDVKPSWTQRSHIALGIARGLAYLHEECNTQIIHCDIKPQNILLDDYYNARISDFGLAKLLMINQSRTNTAIRGTKGYVAPEWFRNTPITVKVDVYSFGVLLLEIICCRRGLEDMETRGEKAILTDWAWDCFHGGRLGDLVENDKEAVLNEWDMFERFVMVGIWCIQEDPSLRPSMREVIQMLDGVVDVTKPSCPSPFSST